MLSLIPLAFAAGVLTIAAPCLLPVLPGIVGGSLGQSKWRPLGIAAGLLVSFTIFGTAFAIFLDFLGISKGALRAVSIVLLFAFGLALAVPTLYEWVLTKATFVWRKINAPAACCAPKEIHNPPQPSLILREGDRAVPHLTISGGDQTNTPLKVRGDGGVMKRNGFWGAFGIGATLGAVWTPCAGPILGVILTFAAQTQNVLKSGLLFFVYGLGAAIPMLILGYGGRALVLRIKGLAHASGRIRQVAGVILVVWSMALWLGVDRYFQANLTQFLPAPRL